VSGLDFSIGRPLRVLAACEFSGKVREAFRRLGHDAKSCDLLAASDGSPHHIRGDVLDVLDDGWDVLIAFPPCTYLCSSGLHWNTRRPGRAVLTEQALAFVRQLLGAKVPRIVLENPGGCISTRIRRSTQIIEPHQFGHDARKATHLWLSGLPSLVPTAYVPGKFVGLCGHPRWVRDLGPTCPVCGAPKKREVWANQTDGGQNRLPPSADRWALRSETYQGIADAMALQWGGVLTYNHV